MVGMAVGECARVLGTEMETVEISWGNLFSRRRTLPLAQTLYAMLSRLGARSLKASTSAARPILGRRLQTTADSSSLIGPIPADGDAPFQIKLHQEYFQTYRCEAPALEMEVTKNQLVDSYKMMVTMRRMEMAADQVRSTLPTLSPCYSTSFSVRRS